MSELDLARHALCDGCGRMRPSVTGSPDGRSQFCRACMDQVAPTPPGYGGRWDLTDGTPDRIVWDLHCIGGATLRRACIASGVPTSGTKVQMARRLYALGLDAARVRSAHTQTGRRD